MRLSMRMTCSERSGKEGRSLLRCMWGRPQITWRSIVSDSCENCDMQIHVLFFFALLDVRNLWNG